jgi:hypothetical protein
MLRLTLESATGGTRLVGCRVVVVMSVDKMLAGALQSVWLGLAYAVMAVESDAIVQ